MDSINNKEIKPDFEVINAYVQVVINNMVKNKKDYNPKTIRKILYFFYKDLDITEVKNIAKTILKEKK